MSGVRMHTRFCQKPWREWPLGKCTDRWEDNIKMDLTGCKGVDWMYMAQDMDQYEPSGSIKDGELLD
jgi:hypothetical protein